MGNTFGHLFRITTWGESHGGGVGVVIDGCPPRIALSEADIQPDLDRRRPGQSRIVTPRKEPDRVEILSGVFEGKTLGTPISLIRRSLAFAVGKAADGPAHAKPSGALLPEPSPKKFCANAGESKCWL